MFLTLTTLTQTQRVHPSPNARTLETRIAALGSPQVESSADRSYATGDSNAVYQDESSVQKWLQDKNITLLPSEVEVDAKYSYYEKKLDQSAALRSCASMCMELDSAMHVQSGCSHQSNAVCVESMASRLAGIRS